MLANLTGLAPLGPVSDSRGICGGVGLGMNFEGNGGGKIGIVGTIFIGFSTKEAGMPGVGGILGTLGNCTAERRAELSKGLPV